MIRLLLISMAAAISLAGSAVAKTLVAVLPPDYAGSTRELVQQFAGLVVGLRSGDRLIIYAAAHGPAQLATIAIPDDPRAANLAWRKRQLAAQFAPVLRYLKGLPSVPAMGGLPANLMIPDVMREIGSNLIPSLPEKRADVLLIGSWLYFDVRDGRFTMSDRLYPSDSHLRAKRTESPFGVAGAERELAGATVHLCWPGGQGEFATKEYEEDVRRFWSLWLAKQSGRVGTFSFDLATCFRRFADGEASGQMPYKASAGGKVEMLRAPLPLPAALPASTAQPGAYFLRDDVPISTVPPSATTGVVWIGIKWSAPCDLDLYARGDSSAPWLFFANARSNEGYYNKDYRAAPGDKQFEYIEMTKSIQLGGTEVAINLYEGALPAPPEGVIRVWFGGRVYEAPFKLEATRGNHGAFPMAGPHWLRIDLRKVVGLLPS